MKTLDQMEAELVYKTLMVFDGNKTKASKSLGISIAHLYRLIKKYGFNEFLMAPTHDEHDFDCLLPYIDPYDGD